MSTLVALTVLCLCWTHGLGLPCYDCDHGNSMLLSGCKTSYCTGNQFCNIDVDKGKVRGHCHPMHEYSKCIEHKLHHCPGVVLGDGGKHCLYCCIDMTCIYHAFGINSTTTTRASISTLTSTSTTIITTNRTSTITTSVIPLPLTYQASSISPSTTSCVDIFPDCSTLHSPCSNSVSTSMCAQFCNACQTKFTTPTPVTTATCADVMPDCSTLHSPCTNPMSISLCAKFCNVCHLQRTSSGSTANVISITTQAPTRMSSATPGSTIQTTHVPPTYPAHQCVDHDVLCTSKDLCTTNPMALQVCPKLCNVCHTVSPTFQPQCVDHAMLCTSKVICTTNPLALQVCPKLCNVCQPGHSHIQSTPTSGKQSPTTKRSTAPPTIRSCHQCGDYSSHQQCNPAELAMGTPSNCSHGSYCMTDLLTATDGTVQLFKRCVDRHTCAQKWYRETSDKSVCVKFNPNQLHRNLVCHFCCVTDNCNDGMLPAQGNLYAP